MEGCVILFFFDWIGLRRITQVDVVKFKTRNDYLDGLRSLPLISIYVILMQTSSNIWKTTFDLLLGLNKIFVEVRTIWIPYFIYILFLKDKL